MGRPIRGSTFNNQDKPQGGQAQEDMSLFLFSSSLRFPVYVFSNLI
jgi:hypothetical protein